jgi:hypothetical protein
LKKGFVVRLTTYNYLVGGDGWFVNINRDAIYDLTYKNRKMVLLLPELIDAFKKLTALFVSYYLSLLLCLFLPGFLVFD